MDKFRMLFQHLQSSSESVMNGVCLLLAAITVKLYTSFDFNCPCLARYNALYGLGLLLTPPLALFLCGLLANRQSVVMVEEWLRPTGHRRKDPGIIRLALTSRHPMDAARGIPTPSIPQALPGVPFLPPPWQSSAQRPICQCPLDQGFLSLSLATFSWLEL